MIQFLEYQRLYTYIIVMKIIAGKKNRDVGIPTRQYLHGSHDRQFRYGRKSTL